MARVELTLSVITAKGYGAGCQGIGKGQFGAKIRRGTQSAKN